LGCVPNVLTAEPCGWVPCTKRDKAVKTEVRECMGVDKVVHFKPTHLHLYHHAEKLLQLSDPQKFPT
jgi:hypothetical protein